MRKILAYALLWMGDAVSRVMDYWPCDFMHPYKLYNMLMDLSHKVQGDRPGPWQSALKSSPGQHADDRT